MNFSNQKRTEHHPWCNFFMTRDPNECKMCKKLYKKYPQNGLSETEMAEKYFSDSIHLRI